MLIWPHRLWTTGLRCAPRTAILRGLAVCVGLTRFPHPEAGKRPKFACLIAPASAKGSLIASDAKLLEDVFEQKLSGFPSPVANDISAGEGATAAEVRSKEEPQASRAGSDEPNGIDKSVLAVAAPRRHATGTSSTAVLAL